MLRKLSIPILSAFLGILVANYFNPIEWISFVPESYGYDICIGLYFTLADVLLSKGFDWAEQHLFAELILNVSAARTSASVETDPEIELDSSGMAELQATLEVRGKRKLLADAKIIIPAMGSVTIQPGSREQGVCLEPNGNYVISVDSLLGQGRNVETTWKFKLVVEMTPLGQPQSERIQPCIDKKYKWRVRFKCNKAVIRMGG